MQKVLESVAGWAQAGAARVAFRLSPHLKSRLADRARHGQCSQADVIKSAIEYAEASGALKAAFEETSTEGLFTRSRRSTAVASVPSEMRLPANERDLIDSLADQYGAKDRTALIVKAVYLYLG